MNREFSLYLDAVRFLAAVLVVVNHSNQRGLITQTLPQLGHSAVMIFFVLSGFVIAYVADTKETDLRSYSISRLARLYSVIPIALLVTVVADHLGLMLNPEYYVSGYNAQDLWGVRVFTSFFFLNEFWNISITTLSNVPYWSLNYEAWYYVLFAAAFFLSGRQRTLALVAICLLVGPKILLLAPIWWLGVYLYHSRLWLRLPESLAWFLFVLSLAGIYYFHALDIRQILGDWLASLIGAHLRQELAYSKSFLSDYLLAILVFLHFAAFRVIAYHWAPILNQFARPIRFLAGYTFALYLLHQPLIFFYAALFDGDPDGWLFYGQVMVSMIITVLLLGSITEKKKAFHRRMASRVVDFVILQKKRFQRI